MNRSGMKCVLYPRVSTEMQVDGFSLDGQRSSLKRFADREEMTVVDIYEDAGKSGKSIEGRPAFKKMLSDIENGLQIDYILVYKLSRFGRNAADILNSLEFIQSYGINLICIEEGIDSSQASGKLLISVLSAVAEIERENIIEQTMNGRKEEARQGGWNGGFAPYGYYLKDKNLFIQEEEAEVIRIIYDKFANTEMGYGGVAQYLNLQGIEAADVVLMDDDPMKIATAIKISRKCLKIVYQNISVAIGVKLICLILGAVGIANMWLAIFADVGVMILAVLNAIRALFVKKL